jgi:hypothetical protein
MFTLWLGLIACRTAPAPTPPAVEPVVAAVAALDVDDPASCAPCHGAVVEEWNASMHASAHHDADPIYGAMRALRIERQGAKVGDACPACHNPRSPDAPDAPAGRVGVSCAACHAVAEVHRERGLGSAALTFDPSTFRGARDLAPGASPAHGTGPASAALADGVTVCLVCHEATTTPTGEAACTTGPEHRADAGAPSCVSCHMPEVDRPSGAVSSRPTHRAHTFAGPHQAWRGDDTVLTSATDLRVSRVGDTASVTITNRSGHAFPTGYPGRLAVISVHGRDAAGAVVFTSAPDLPGATMGKVYVDADGRPVAAPFSVRLASDTRLQPGEQRVIDVPLLPGVATIEAELWFWLIPPPAAASLGLSASPLAEPRVARRATP